MNERKEREKERNRCKYVQKYTAIYRRLLLESTKTVLRCCGCCNSRCPFPLHFIRSLVSLLLLLVVLSFERNRVLNAVPYPFFIFRIFTYAWANEWISSPLYCLRNPVIYCYSLSGMVRIQCLPFHSHYYRLNILLAVEFIRFSLSHSSRSGESPIISFIYCIAALNLITIIIARSFECEKMEFKRWISHIGTKGFLRRANTQTQCVCGVVCCRERNGLQRSFSSRALCDT